MYNPVMNHIINKLESRGLLTKVEIVEYSIVGYSSDELKFGGKIKTLLTKQDNVFRLFIHESDTNTDTLLAESKDIAVKQNPSNLNFFAIAIGRTGKLGKLGEVEEVGKGVTIFTLKWNNVEISFWSLQSTCIFHKKEKKGYLTLMAPFH